MSSSGRLRVASLFLATACLAAGSPASAQWYGGGWGSYSYNYPPPPPGYANPNPYRARPLQPDEITDRLEDLGFEDIGRPRYTGQNYMVDATTGTGNRVRLVVDAVRGTVLNRYALGRVRGRDTDEADVAGFAAPQPFRYGARPAPSPYDEMPAQPEAREPTRREAALPRASSRQPLAPPSATPAAPLPAPADARLSPQRSPDGAPAAAAPDRQASREPPALATKPGAIQGLNPSRSAPVATRPAATGSSSPNTARVDAKPASGSPPGLADPANAPAAPVPKLPEARGDAAARAATAEPRTAAAQPADVTPRKPVRVIGGVTPLNGGQQATPGPVNQVDGTAPR